MGSLPDDSDEEPPVVRGPRPNSKLKIGDALPEEIHQQDIDRLLDEADDVHIETLNEVALKRMILQLERKIKKNQEMRIKHADEPDKFLKSEVDLDEEVKRLTKLAGHPELYGELVELGALPTLIGLLNHANTDIAVDVFEVLSELSDPDVIAEVPEPEAFVEALFEAQLCELSVDVLLRIQEDSEEEIQAVTNCLNMMENLADVNPNDCCTRLAKVPKLLPWLIKRVRTGATVDYNRVYASEILGIVLQNSEQAREAMVKLEGVDKLLRGVAAYRKRDPVDSEESEFVQNMFDALCTLMLLPSHQVTFGKLQGLELMIRIMRECKFASPLALKLAGHSMRHCADNCHIFVEKLGLKVLFALFMKRGPRPKTKGAIREAEEHIVTIIQSLCRYCTGTSVARVINKFMEDRFEKLERLLELHEEYLRSVKNADAKRLGGELEKIDRELEVNEEEQLFLDRCDAGLFTLQQVDIVLVRLANMGNRQVAGQLGQLMDIKGVDGMVVADVIMEYCANLGPDAAEEASEVRSFSRSLLKRMSLEVPKTLEEPVKDSNGDAGVETDEEAAVGAKTPEPEDDVDDTPAPAANASGATGASTPDASEDESSSAKKEPSPKKAKKDSNEKRRERSNGRDTKRDRREKDRSRSRSREPRKEKHGKDRRDEDRHEKDRKRDRR